MLACTALAAVAAPPTALRFERLGSAQGLQQESVFAIAQGQRGFVWLGTQNGLSRYDGYRVSNFINIPGDPASLADNWVAALHVDPHNNLWIGTQAGLQQYDIRNERFMRPLALPKGIRDSALLSINVLVGDGQGGLWIGTRGGLQHLDMASGRVDTMRHQDDDPDSLGGNVVRSLALDQQGNLWVGTRTGLDRLAKGSRRFEHFERSGNGDLRDAINALLVDGKRLWVGTSAGLERWNIDAGALQRQRYGKQQGAPESAVMALQRDRNGDIWIGSTIHGLYQWQHDSDTFRAFPNREGDSHSPGAGSVIALMQDSSGSLWAGTLNSGVSWADLGSGGFHRILHTSDDPTGLSGNTVTRMVAAEQGKLWVATRNHGLNLYDPVSGVARHFRHQPGNPASIVSDEVYALAYDGRRRLWIGTSKGLSRYDPQADRFYNVEFQTSDSGVNTVYELIGDRAGALWIGSARGLHRYDTSDDSVRHYVHRDDTPDGLSNDVIYTLREDRLGRIWIGTSSGLDLFTPSSGRWQHFRHDPKDPSSIDHNRIWSMLEDRDGVMWVGTALGLNRSVASADGGLRFRAYPSKPTVDAIQQAADGRLWISTDAGISVFDPVSGKREDFSSSDGLTEGDFANSSSLQTADGTIYFGSFVGGITVFRPEQVRRNPVAPSVVLTDFQVLNQPVRANTAMPGLAMDAPILDVRDITLSYRHNVFSIEFAALHYAAPRRNQYAYQLEGFDRDWISTDAAKRYATYTNLDPGTYQFRVKGSNKDGVWAELAPPLRITITPPFWQTWWFRLLGLSFVLLLGYGAYLVRIQAFVQREQALEENVRERNQAVDAAVSALHATQQQLILREKMASIGTLTAGIAHEINNPVNFAHVGAQALDTELETFRADLLKLSRDDEDGEAGGAVAAMLNRRFDRLNSQVDNVIEGTSRIRILVKDLLSFARLGEAERKAVAIGDSLLATVNLVRSYYSGRVEIDCQLATNPVLECWPSLLNQVFMNLIVNACQAIEVRYPRNTGHGAGRLEIRSSLRADQLVLEFIDNGCGIPAAALPRIFEPFFTTKQEGEGTGLGLSTSFGIVAQHGGSLSVSSTPDVGSTFTVRLPLHGAQPA